jgi:hypothetical protein
MATIAPYTPYSSTDPAKMLDAAAITSPPGRRTTT